MISRLREGQGAANGITPDADLDARDPYLQARAADVCAVGDQVVRSLLGITGSAAEGRAGVLVAGDLTPAAAAELRPERVVAVLMAFSSSNAHSAILLRAKGIPAVVGAGQAVLNIEDGELVAVDGGRGEYVVDPPAEVREAYAARATDLAEHNSLDLEHAAAPAHPGGGGVAGRGEHRLGGLGPDLAGRVRTEFLFVGRAAAPS